MSEEQRSLEGEKLRREHDSMDDFEHLGHDGLPVLERKEIRETKERAREEELIDIGNIARSLEEKLAKGTGESQPGTVPATPPPSADFEKFEAMAQSSDPFQRPLNQVFQVDPKAATVAFMDTERVYAPHDQPTPPPEPEFPKDVLEFDASPRDSWESRKLEELVEQHPVAGQRMDLLGSDFPGDLKDNSIFEKPGTDSDLLADFGGDVASSAPFFSPSASASSSSKEPRKEEGIPKSEAKFIDDLKSELFSDFKASVLPAPEKSPTLDFLGDFPKEERGRVVEDGSWNLVERPDKPLRTEDPLMEPPTKPLPPLPKDADFDKYEMSNDFVIGEVKGKQQQSGAETGDSEFESEPEPSPAKVPRALKEPEEPKEPRYKPLKRNKVEDIEIAPKEIFRDMGLDAWFNPERLHPKVAALIYWRDPKKSGIVFGVILGVLLSLTYFSLISVVAHLSLLVLTGTVCFRVYKTVLQAVQKTSDGHPFKDILDLDLNLPAEKVHEVADVAVAHANAAVGELRSLFLVEDFVDSLKFGVVLWCLTYLGSWFNGMTLIIIGVVALFTLPKVYETNKVQIDQNLALVQGKINELTAKVKAAIPLGKKPEPTKEE